MKKLFLFSSTLFICCLFVFTFMLKDTKAILYDRYDYVINEPVIIAADDMETDGFNSCFLTCNPTLYYTGNLGTHYFTYYRGFNDLITYIGADYVIYYAVLNVSSLSNLRLSNGFVNLYLTSLGSFIDDSQYISNYNDTLQSFCYISDSNSVNYSDMITKSYKVYENNTNCVYYDGSNSYYCDSIKLTFGFDSSRFNQGNTYFVGFVLYGLSNPSDINNYNLLTASFDFSYELNNNADYTQGYDDGYNQGIDVGYQRGINESSADSYNDGYNLGYNNGYNVGVNSSDKWFANGLISLFTIPFAVFNQIWDFEFLGFNLSSLFYSLLTFAILLWIIKKFFFK